MESQVQLTFQTLEFFMFSWELWGLEDWNLVHMWAVGSCIMYTGIRLLLLIRPFISSFFFLSSFQHWNFSSHFSRELSGLEDWNLVHTWTVGRCIMSTRIRLLLLIHPFISSFFFLSNFEHHVHWNPAAASYSSLYFFIFLSLQFSTLKFFFTLFSGTVRPRRLKLCTHIDSGQMYQVYQNQAAAAYSYPYFFIFLSLQFSTLKFFVTLFSGTLRPRRLKLDIHMNSGQMYHVYQNQAAAAYSSLYFFIFLSLQFSTLKFLVTLFWGIVRPRRLKLGTHVNSGQMFHVYQNHASVAHSSLYFFIFLSLQFSTLKFFVTLFLWTMRPRRLKIGTLVDSGQMYHVYQIQAAVAYSSLYFFIFLSL